MIVADLLVVPVAAVIALAPQRVVPVAALVHQHVVIVAALTVALPLALTAALVLLHLLALALPLEEDLMNAMMKISSTM